jgi:DNA-binding MurR/RpiR family transcriptional regulator
MAVMAETRAAPRDFAALKAEVIARANALPKRLSQIAAFALERPDDVAFGTVASIAEQAQVQPSSLIRFAQAMGYQGFSELQEIFRARLRERVPSYEERIALLREHAKSASKAHILFEGFCEAAQKSLADLATKIESETLDRAVARLAGAENIYIIGLRRSFPISSYMAYAFGKLAIRHVLVDGLGGLASNDIAFATRRDAVLAVSFTPYASETVALVAQAVRARVPLIAITDSAFSPLARDAESWFEVAEANFEGFRSLAATLSLAMTLTVAVAEKRSG